MALSVYCSYAGASWATHTVPRFSPPEAHLPVEDHPSVAPPSAFWLGWELALQKYLVLLQGQVRAPGQHSYLQAEKVRSFQNE